MAAGNRYSEEQIIKVLGEIEPGMSIARVAHVRGISFNQDGKNPMGDLNEDSLVNSGALDILTASLRLEGER